MRLEPGRNMQIRTGVGIAGDQLLLQNVLLEKKTRGVSVAHCGSRTTVRRLATRNFLIVFLGCISLVGQNAILTGALSGRITDQSDAVVSGASVVVRNLETGVKQSTSTNHSGLYRFPALAPGSYA